MIVCFFSLLYVVKLDTFCQLTVNFLTLDKFVHDLPEPKRINKFCLANMDMLLELSKLPHIRQLYAFPDTKMNAAKEDEWNRRNAPHRMSDA